MTIAIAIGREIAYHQEMRFCEALSQLRLVPLLPLALAALAGCGDGGSSSMPDANLGGSCPSGELFFTGELVDWGSTAGSFQGVFDAAFTVEGDPARTDTTSPNGRFELCLRDAALTRVQVDATSASTYLDGVAVVDRAVLAAGATMSLRSFTAMREMTFSPRLEIGKAQVLVDVAGAQRAVTLGVPYQAAFAFDGASWAPGTTGRAVFFANVDLAAAPAAATMAGSYVGGGSIPLDANRLTFVTMVGK